jgi:hypothetical protein
MRLSLAEAAPVATATVTSTAQASTLTMISEADGMDEDEIDSIPYRIPRSPSNQQIQQPLVVTAIEDSAMPDSSTEEHEPSSLQFDLDPHIDSLSSDPPAAAGSRLADLLDLDISISVPADEEQLPNSSRTLSAPPSPSRALLSRIDRVLSSPPGRAFDDAFSGDHDEEKISD